MKICTSSNSACILCNEISHIFIYIIQSSFFNCIIYTYYAMVIMFLFAGKLRFRAFPIAYGDLYVKYIIEPLNPRQVKFIDFEVAMHILMHL